MNYLDIKFKIFESRLSHRLIERDTFPLTFLKKAILNTLYNNTINAFLEKSLSREREHCSRRV
jgi:hypothetical protein